MPLGKCCAIRIYTMTFTTQNVRQFFARYYYPTFIGLLFTVLWSAPLVCRGQQPQSIGDDIFPITRPDTLLRPGKFLYLFTDTTNRLTIDDILQPQYQAAFQRHPYDFSSQSAPRYAHWVKLTFVNHTHEQFWLSNQDAFVKYIDFYAADSSGVFKNLYQTGIMRPDRNKAFRYSNKYWLPLSAPKGKIATVYIRMEGGTVFPLRIHAGSLATLVGQKTITDYAFGILTGLICVMLGYHIFLIFATRASIYITYSLYLCGALLVGPHLIGYYDILMLLLPASFKPWLLEYFLVWHNIFYVMVIVFAIHLLRLRQQLPYVFNYLLVQLLVFGLIIPLLNITASVPFYLLFAFYQFNIFVLYVSLMSVGFYLWMRKKDSMAFFYTIAWVWIVSASFIYLSYINNLLPYHWLTILSPVWGVAIEILFFSLAIGNRINLMRQENLRLVTEQNMFLERKVTERTSELSAANHALQNANEELTVINAKLDAQSNELEYLNQTKNKLFAIVGHDLRNPISSLLGLLSLLETKSIGQEEFIMFSDKLKASVESLYATLDNLLLWANNQLWGIKTEPQPFSIHAAAAENIGLLGEMAQAKNIVMDNLIPTHAVAFADLDQIKLVFRNLMSNAIKFTPMNGKITLTAVNQNKQWHIGITDTGAGMSQEKLAKLFTTEAGSTKGTNQEKGTGLGLMLCKDFVEKNGGQIGANSTEGTGSTFYFTVPAVEVFN